MTAPQGESPATVHADVAPLLTLDDLVRDLQEFATATGTGHLPVNVVWLDSTTPRALIGAYEGAILNGGVVELSVEPAA